MAFNSILIVFSSSSTPLIGSSMIPSLLAHLFNSLLISPVYLAFNPPFARHRRATTVLARHRRATTAALSKRQVSGVAFDPYWLLPNSDDTGENTVYRFGSVGQLAELKEAEKIREGNCRRAEQSSVLVKQVCDGSSSTSWDPMVIWKGICESTDERMHDAGRVVKAVDCLDWSEVDIELGQFMKGYSEGRLHENGSPQMLKLKDWPSPSASEEFFLYQRPEFISKVPFLEFIHSKWGF